MSVIISHLTASYALNDHTFSDYLQKAFKTDQVFPDILKQETLILACLPRGLVSSWESPGGGLSHRLAINCFSPIPISVQSDLLIILMTGSF